MHIRTYRDPDFDDVLSLTIDTFRPFYEDHFRPLVGDAVFGHQHGSWRDDYRRQVADLHDPDRHRFVDVAEDGRLLGYVGWNVDVGRRHGTIDILAVDSAARGAGIGTELCEQALTRMRELGAEVVEIGTGGDDFHAPARRLYERLGLTPYPVVAYLGRL
jgi:ribosomal protein S18 acetylase RimI-like enzyme